MVLTQVFLSLVVGTCLISDGEGAKILMFPFGHFNHPILKYTEHLSTILAENHSVSLLINEAYQPPQVVKQAGVKMINFKRPIDDDTPEQNLNMSLDKFVHMSLYDFYRLEGDASRDFCKSIVKDKELLQRIQNQKFDLMFIDCVELCGNLLASHLEIPAITLQWDLSVAKIENKEFSFDLSYFPHDFLPNIHDVMTFPQRLSNVVDFVLAAYSMSYFQNRMARIAYKNRMTMKDVDDLKLIYGNFPFEYPTLTSPDMVFAGDLFIKSPKQLPADVKKFMSDKRGVIVVSFSEFIYDYGDRFLTIFSEALSDVPYNVVWHYQGSVKPQGLGKNVKIVDKFERPSYLSHPNVKLFICGSTVGDAYEATYFGVPILAIPLNVEGYRDATRLAKHFKMGEKMDILQLTAISLKREINEAMENEEYQTNADEMKRLVRDQPMDSHDVLDYWINYMIKYKSAKHLIPYGRHMPWYKYYLIDVAIFLKLVLLLLIYGVYRLVRYIKQVRQPAQPSKPTPTKSKSE